MDAEAVMNSHLIEQLQSIRDYRSPRGKRYPLWVMLLVTVLGTMSGAEGYQALEEFGMRHYSKLCTALGLTLKRLPSDTTLRRMFHAISMPELTTAFNDWAMTQFNPDVGECLSMDGKSLSSTLTGHTESFQNFVGVVSLYSHRHRLVIAQTDYQNKLESEISVVQNLLETLELSGVTVTFDALHCQKKRCSSSSSKGITMSSPLKATRAT
jgi:hypothetical protein